MLRAAVKIVPAKILIIQIAKTTTHVMAKKPLIPFFKVRQGDRGFKPPEAWCQLIPCDTFNTSSVRFDAPDENPANSTYEWQIGTEVNPRKGKGLEIGFGDYLRDNGWERWIPIKLTIRTPLNSCLTNLRDTLVTVERKLFFTEKRIAGLFIGITEREEKFVGTLNGVPNSEIKLIQKRSGSFIGYTTPIYLMIGLPHIDTLAFPSKYSWFESCESFLQIRVIHLTYQSCMEDVSYHFSGYNSLFSPDRKKLELDLTFDPPGGRKQFNFKGTLAP